MSAVAIEAEWARPEPRFRTAALPVAILCLAAIVAFLWRYPLTIWPLVGILAIYAWALWRWPAAWLVAVPASIAGFDLTPWTGWTMVGEADLVIAATVGILVLRDPPALADLLPKGKVRTVIVFYALALGIAGVVGFASPLGAGQHSDLPYLRPDDAFRLSKGFLTALLLMPFLRHRERMRGDATSLLAVGFLAGLSLVAVETFIERAVFPGAFDIASLYPASGPFSGMHVGGGHLGIYVATVFPFALLRRDRNRRVERFALRVIDLATTYVLIATFSVIIYGAAAVSTLLTFFGRTGPRGDAGHRRRNGEKTPARAFTRAGYAAMMMLAASAILLGDDAIRNGVGKVFDNIAHREHALSRRFELRDHDLRTVLFGMGLGAYPRVVAARAEDGRSDFSVDADDAAAGVGNQHLSLMTGGAFFLGQKVPVVPGPDYQLSLSLRSPDGQAYAIALLCEKHLLNSQNCSGHEFKPGIAGKWESFSAPLSTAAMDPDARFGPIRRPIDLSFFTLPRNRKIEIKDIRLTAPDGREMVVNGDFAHGADRWYFSDENHDYWQIMNQYLMIQFESGLFGVAAFLWLTGAALLGARRAMRLGDKVGTAIVASLGTFLFLCLFESPLRSEPISATFHLLCLCGLIMLERGTDRAYLKTLRPAWRPAQLSAQETIS